MATHQCKGSRSTLTRTRFFKDQSGITLLELTVVSAILAILAALVAVGVSGKATESRESTRGNDQAEVQKAVDSFSGEHPHSRYPTFNGCLPGKKYLDLTTRLCLSSALDATTGGANDDTREFPVAENTIGVDLNGDGSITAYSATVAPIIWDKAFTTTEGTTRKFVPNYVPRYPKHAFELLTGDFSWKSATTVTDPDNSSVVAPTTVELTDVPVWVLDGNGKVWILLPEGRY